VSLAFFGCSDVRTTWITLGSGRIEAVKLAANDRIFIVVREYPTGSLHEVTGIGAMTEIASGFGEPWGLAIDSQGDLLVASVYGGGITKFHEN